MANAVVIKYDPVEVAQTIGVTHPWQELFSVPLDDIVRLPHNSQDWKVYLYYQWTVALHWVIKLGWQSAHNPPFKKSQMQASKPKGFYLHSIRSLCNFCFSESLPDATPYGHPCYWVQDLYREMFWQEIRLEGSGELNKQQLLQRKQKVWHQLKFGFENPANRDTNPATWLLYEIALPMAEQSKAVSDDGSSRAQFQRLWQAFLAAMSDEIKSLQTHGATFDDDGDKIFIQEGKGRGRKQLTLSRTGSLERKPRKGYKS